jgi:hypothetical protein
MADEKRKGSKVMFCSCEHKSQDEIHGSHKRVHNAVSNEKKPPWRCTVCGNEKG